MNFRRKNVITLIAVIATLLILLGILVSFIIKNSNTSKIGIVVETSDKWKIVDSTQVATVYTVALENGVVPVPYGFYYVGGNLDTGVIISDNEADKYDGKIDKTTWEYTTSLKGNQFVWIPCAKAEYKKTDWGVQGANWDATVHQAEIQQIEKYGGFYVARYEAGLATSIPEYTTTQQHIATNGVYNKNGIPQSKAGIVPWNFIDWHYAKRNAESMYSNNYVSSGLITGTQWDVMLNKFMQKEGLTTADLTNSTSWGNYKENSIKYKGRKATAYYEGSSWYLPVFEKVAEGKTTAYTTNNADFLTTGASSQTEKYHIFDIAGNFWEWTEETGMQATTNQYRVVRGGSAWNASPSYAACYRSGLDLSSNLSAAITFRIVLYLK